MRYSLYTFKKFQQIDHPQRFSRLIFTRGLSIMELIVYIAIVSVIVVVIADAFISLSQSSSHLDSRTEVDSSLRFVQAAIVRDIASASSVALPGIMGGSSSILQLTLNGDVIVYDVSLGRLTRKVNAAAPAPMTSAFVVSSAPLFSRLENFNAVLGATTTSIRFTLMMRYNSANPALVYANTITTAVALP